MRSREFSNALTDTWTRAGPAAVTVLSDDGLRETAKVTVPEGSAGKRFVRLRITRL